ncbi:MAG: sugar transferase, partial [Bacteroidota bacterium]|nr:sugar transferase [Bacteroidota bacterium]
MKPTQHSLLLIGSPENFQDSLFTDPRIHAIHATNVLEAVRVIQSGQLPAVVVCAMHLSGKDGFYFFDWMKSIPAFREIPFILVSQTFSVETYKKALLDSVSDYYTTSQLDADTLVNRIDFILAYQNRAKGIQAGQPSGIAYRMPLSKRLFDITVASLALLFLSPLLILVSLAIVLESRGKIYYSAKRVGRNVFGFYKLRSMRTGADQMLKKLATEKNQYGTANIQTDIDFSLPCPRCSQQAENKSCSPIMYIDNHQICDYWYQQQKKALLEQKPAFVKIKDDPRITRVGKFIRNTSIDELPQLINVIKGDMSIVGNRPLPVYEAEMLTVDDLSKRFLAPAGITGLWQVELRGKGGNMSEQERKNLDNEYADHFKDGKYSFWYDMGLILRTIPA